MRGATAEHAPSRCSAHLHLSALPVLCDYQTDNSSSNEDDDDEKEDRHAGWTWRLNCTYPSRQTLGTAPSLSTISTCSGYAAQPTHTGAPGDEWT